SCFRFLSFLHLSFLLLFLFASSRFFFHHFPLFLFSRKSGQNLPFIILPVSPVSSSILPPDSDNFCYQIPVNSLRYRKKNRSSETSTLTAVPARNRFRFTHPSALQIPKLNPFFSGYSRRTFRRFSRSIAI